MAVSLMDFLADARFAQLADLGEGVIEAVLNDASADCDRVGGQFIWGNRYERAIKLLTGHRLTVHQNQQAGMALAGAISNLNVSNGSQSVGFGGGSSSPEDPEAFASTVFGREFAGLVKGLPLCGLVI
jgi:hypothetical protein